MLSPCMRITFALRCRPGICGCSSGNWCRGARPRSIDYHTDVTIPWAQAKLMHLYLGINIMLYERQNGDIIIPKSVLPAPLASPPEGADTSSPDSVETFQSVQQKIKEF